MRYSKISRFLSLVLRHKPEAIGLTLDASGWVDVVKLIEGARKAGYHFTHDIIHWIVESNDKQRFALSQDGLRIRASQGHSVSIDIALPESVPPETLYHGTSKASLAAIRREGIKPKGRIHVHLCPDEETALKVGSRHGPPVVLTVRAGQMHHHGFQFFLSENGVWLTDWVPVEFVDNVRS